ncbi:MAG: PEP-CTERM sorting domain-containing protein [Planctomycetota bacterium]|nr:PEP-CTERM sorting domain-containing protein [Planctomycetota bacterium]
MPIVMKSSDNGFVDAKSKTIRLPDHLMPRAARFESLRRAAVAAVPMVVMSISSLPTQANVVTLSDGNATAQFDTTNGTGLNSLLVSGTQEVVSQWFDYRVGAAAGPAVPIDSANNGVTQTFISLPGSGPGGAGFAHNNTTNFFSVTYSSPTGGPNGVPFSYQVKYTLTGNSPSGASISENVNIDNNSSTTALPISMYEYNHFNLNNQQHDTVVLSGTPINTATQTSVLTGASNIETAAIPSPSFYQAATGNTLLTEFASPSFTNLSPATTTAGPGDVSWAFEWNPTIPANGSFDISKVRTITVPEPTTLAGAIGAVGLCLARRPRKNRTEAE